MKTGGGNETTSEAETVRTRTSTIVDDPIKRMTWSLGPDNKTRYPGRLKMVLDYIGLTRTGDEDYESLRIAALEFVKMVKENPERVEDMLRDFITYQEQSSEGRNKTDYHTELH